MADTGAADQDHEASWSLASPLTLILEEEARGDRQCEEALLLSYTSDLGYVESIALGVIQATGARVTIVGDASMSSYDPRAVRRAGRSYVCGLADCSGAFHPKLLVLLGAQRVTVGIGSGNVSLAGWQSNAELWTVIRGDRAMGAPSALGDLSTWLRDLEHNVRLSRAIPEALGRVADGIDALRAAGPNVDDEGVRIVHSSEVPILEQLPVGPVDELAVCAPFHDSGAATLRALVDRLQPAKLIISLQPGMTELDGPAVAALAAEHGAQLRHDGEQRYRHGKLVEWAAGGQRYALTGSPNLSGAAMRRTIRQGGNCELAVITAVPATLMPEGTDVDGTFVHAFTLRPQRRTPPSLLLLGALRVDGGLHVQFARPIRTDSYLEISAAAAPPESWERIADVPAGTSGITVTVAAEGGSRIRAAADDPDGRAYSNLVFVIDPARATRRPGITAGHAPTTQPTDLFGDFRLAERFFTDLATLQASRTAQPTNVTAAATSRTQPTSTRVLDRADDGWQRYLDTCAGRLGHPLIRFALGLPDVALAGGQTPFDALIPVSWDESFEDDSAPGLDDDTAEMVADETKTTEPVIARLPDLSREPADVRRRYRQWCERLADAATRLGLPERMLIVRLLLWTIAAHAWAGTEESWVPVLGRAVAAMGDSDIPDAVEPQVGSLAAVAVSVLRANTPRYVGTIDAQAYERAATASAHLLAAADATYIEEYAALLEAAFGGAVNADTVATVALDIVQADPLADAMWALRERGRDVHRDGPCLLHVRGRFGNPILAALEAVGAAGAAPLAGAWATADGGAWALVMWQRPDIVVIDAGRHAPFWRHYKVGPLIGVRNLALDGTFDAAAAIAHGPFMQSFPEAEELLDAFGLQSPTPPTNCAE